jgi:hypothetical protein
MMMSTCPKGDIDAGAKREGCKASVTSVDSKAGTQERVQGVQQRADPQSHQRALGDGAIASPRSCAVVHVLS